MVRERGRERERERERGNRWLEREEERVEEKILIHLILFETGVCPREEKDGGITNHQSPPPPIKKTEPVA